jgi:hypothetical protein
MADLSLGDALATIDAALRPETLNDLQEQVFRPCWLGKTYQEIAVELGYDANYIRLAGFQLWKELSQVFEREITKNNFHEDLPPVQQLS